MNSFQLIFWGEEPTLVETKLQLRNEIFRSVRGKTPGAQMATGTFQWTRAVRAMCLLFVKSASLETPNSMNRYVTISGGIGSLAASLDYAISKEPIWLLEMFGLELRGHTRAKRFFLRSNSELKRPGPVHVGLNYPALNLDSFEIWWNEEMLITAQRLSLLTKKLDEFRVDSINPEHAVALRHTA